MSDFWRAHWEDHVNRVGDDPTRQVQRTEGGRPQSAQELREIASYVGEVLEIGSDHRVLDLCCGNGWLSSSLAARCRSLVGVDFTPRLMTAFARAAPQNCYGVIGDAGTIEFPPVTFDRCLLAAALQHFDHREVIELFTRLARWLRPDGIWLITDVPDLDRMWTFFDSDERERAHFDRLREGRPVLGEWFQKDWIERLGRYTGFREIRVLDQPSRFTYSRYRFDVVCRL